jgi:hypothetical protein
MVMAGAKVLAKQAGAAPAAPLRSWLDSALAGQS